MALEAVRYKFRAILLFGHCSFSGSIMEQQEAQGLVYVYVSGRQIDGEGALI